MAAGRYSNKHFITESSVATEFISLSQEGQVNALIGLLDNHFVEIFNSGALDQGCQQISDPVQRRAILKKAIEVCPSHLIPLADSPPLSIKSLLHLVTEYNEIALAFDLIKNKKHAVDVVFDADEDEDSKTPLLLAVSLSIKEMVQLLLMQKADLHFVSRNGFNALHIAISKYRQQANMSVIKILLNHAAPNLTAGNFLTTLAVCSYVPPICRDTKASLTYDVIPIWKEFLDKIDDPSLLHEEDELGLSAIQYILFYKNKDVLFLIIQKLKTLNFFNKVKQNIALFQHEKNFTFNMLLLCDPNLLPTLLIGLIPSSVGGEPKIRWEVMDSLLGSIEQMPVLRKMISSDLRERLIEIFHFYRTAFGLLKHKKENAKNLLEYKVEFLSTYILNVENLSAFEKSMIAYVKDVLLRLRQQMQLHILDFLKFLIEQRISTKKVQEIINHLQEVFSKMVSTINIVGSENDWNENLFLPVQPVAGALAGANKAEKIVASSLKAACMQQDIETVIYLLEVKNTVPEFDILVACIDAKLNESVKVLLCYSYKYNLKMLFENIMNPLTVAVGVQNESALNMLLELAAIDYPHLLNQLSIELKYIIHRLLLKQTDITAENKKLSFYYRIQQELRSIGVEENGSHSFIDYFVYFLEQAVDEADIQVLVQLLHTEKNHLGLLLENIGESKWLGLAKLLNKKNLPIDEILLTIAELISDDYIRSVNQSELTYPSLGHIAVYFKSKALINAVHARGYSLNKALLPSGSSPIYAAAESENYIDIFLHLLTVGIDIDSVNSKGYTVLYFAILNKNIAAAKALISKGASINKIGPNSISPIKLALNLCINRENIELIQFITQTIMPNYQSPPDQIISTAELDLFFYILSSPSGYTFEHFVEFGFLPARMKRFYNVEFIDYVCKLIEAANDFPSIMKPFAQGFLKQAVALVGFDSINNKAADSLASKITSLSSLVSEIKKVELEWDALEHMQKEYCLSIIWLFSQLMQDVITTLNKVSIAIRSSTLSMDKQTELITSLLSTINKIDVVVFDVHFNHMLVWCRMMEKAKFLLSSHLDEISDKQEQDKKFDALLNEENKPKTKSPRRNKKNVKKKEPTFTSLPSESSMPSLAEGHATLPPELAIPSSADESFIMLDDKTMANFYPTLQLVEEMIGVKPFLVGGAVLALLSPETMKTNDLDLVFSSLDKDGEIARKLLDKEFHFPPPLLDPRLTLYQYAAKDKSLFLDLTRVGVNDPEWLAADAMRRDLSICAIYAQIIKQDDGRYKMFIYDPTGRGLKDFKDGILHMDNPLLRFNQHPARILRTLKYMAKGKGFKPEADLLAALKTWVPNETIMTKYVIDHLWNTLKKTINFSTTELTDQERLFLFHLKDLGLVSKLFNTTVPLDISEGALKEKLIFRSKARKTPIYDYYPYYSAGFFSQPIVSPPLGHPLDFVFKDTAPRN